MARYIIMITGWLVLTFSCNAPDHKGDLLVGDWVLNSASRQGRPTSTLDGLRFTFTSDSVYTNLPVFENHNYIYANDSVKILSSDPYAFHVFHVDSVQLNLDGLIRNVRFRLNFQRSRP